MRRVRECNIIQQSMALNVGNSRVMYLSPILSCVKVVFPKLSYIPGDNNNDCNT